MMNEGVDKKEIKNNNDIKKQHRKYVGLILIGVVMVLVIGVFIFDKVISGGKNNVVVKQEELRHVSLGTDVIPGEKLWHEHFNVKLADESEARKIEQDKAIETMKASFEDMMKKQQEAIEMLKDQLELYSQELQVLKTEPIVEEKQEQNVYGVLQMYDTKNTKNDLPKDISIYIPASTFIKGRLLSGISVSTGVSTQSSPMPIIIRLQENAKLPNGFQTDLHDCRVVGSCYGDLSSERAIVRLESLVCVNRESKQSIETKVAGFVTGDDGVSGIRGVVVSMDSKHIKNAAIGSLFGGLSRGLKNDTTVSVNPTLGLIQEKQGFTDKVKDGTLVSAGDGMQKIADYYIKRAESISPVIQIPSGALVDVVFTEGVYFGQLNTKEIINDNRGKKNDTAKNVESY